MDECEHLLEVATTAAQTGGDVLMKYFRDGVEIRSKADDGGKAYDLVSDADLESEVAIAKHLRSYFPHHELLAEEALAGGQRDAEHLWIIDPLDGTNNFAHRLRHFAVSIAYYRAGRPYVGVVINPATHDCFTAIAGRGAFHNGEPIHVSAASQLSQTMVGCGFYYDRGEMMRRTLRAIEAFFGQEVHGIRRFGTAALDLCLVANGSFGGFFEYLLSPWDFAAGRLIVEEAGGRVTTALGDDLPMSPTSLVASNGRLHEAMVSITTQHDATAPGTPG